MTETMTPADLDDLLFILDRISPHKSGYATVCLEEAHLAARAIRALRREMAEATDRIEAVEAENARLNARLDQVAPERAYKILGDPRTTVTIHARAALKQD